MTCLSTYPRNGVPAYAVHDTEAAAAAHSKWLIDSNTTTRATYFELVLPDERDQP